jgi:hypothetical protein
MFNLYSQEKNLKSVTTINLAHDKFNITEGPYMVFNKYMSKDSRDGANAHYIH